MLVTICSHWDAHTGCAYFVVRGRACIFTQLDGGEDALRKGRHRRRRRLDLPSLLSKHPPPLAPHEIVRRSRLGMASVRRRLGERLAYGRCSIYSGNWSAIYSFTECFHGMSPPFAGRRSPPARRRAWTAPRSAAPTPLPKARCRPADSAVLASSRGIGGGGSSSTSINSSDGNST
eukprot:gene14472-biopygen9609